MQWVDGEGNSGSDGDCMQGLTAARSAPRHRVAELWGLLAVFKAEDLAVVAETESERWPLA